MAVCMRYRPVQDISPQPKRTIGEIFEEKFKAAMIKKKKVKARKFIANDTHVPIPRFVIEDGQRKDILRNIKRKECSPRDVAVMLEDLKGQMDAESFGSGLTEYHKWKTPTQAGRIGFVPLQHFGYVGPSHPLPLFS